MCPYTLDHNKMLASTMQHSTHNHTPNHQPPPHPHHGCVRRPSPRADQRTTPTQVSPQDPTACQARPGTHRDRPNQQQKCSTQPHHTHTPATTGKPATTSRVLDHGMESKERRTPTPRAGGRHPTNTVRLLRKEVIQPHLPVRLPCYDFVPIASPTFDHSPPHAG